MKKELLAQKINILKSIAIIAVIILHVIGAALVFGSPTNSLLVLDQIMRFCVPLFIGISGFTLALSLEGKQFSWSYFLKRRVVRLLPQYLFWSGIIYFYLQLIPYWHERTYQYPIWQQILLGKTDYHLYFVPLIVQFYLLFPFLFWLVKKWATSVLFGSLIVQVGTYVFIAQHVEVPGYNLVWSDQHQYIYFLSWQFYFVLGIYLVQAREVLKSKSIMACAMALLFGGLVWEIVSALSLYGQHVDIVNATRFTKLSTLLYGSAFLFVAIGWAASSHSVPHRIGNLFARIGRDSYTTYLSHTLVLRTLILLFLSVFGGVTFSLLLGVIPAALLVGSLTPYLFSLKISKK